METAQLCQQQEYIGHLHQKVIMVGENAPCESLVDKRLTDGEQVVGKCVDAFGGVANKWLMLVAGGGDVESPVAVIGTVGWGMPGPAVLLSLCQQVGALVWGQLTPDIAWFGHGAPMPAVRVVLGMSQCQRTA